MMISGFISDFTPGPTLSPTSESVRKSSSVPMGGWALSLTTTPNPMGFPGMKRSCCGSATSQPRGLQNVDHVARESQRLSIAHGARDSDPSRLLSGKGPDESLPLLRSDSPRRLLPFEFLRLPPRLVQFRSRCSEVGDHLLARCFSLAAYHLCPVLADPPEKEARESGANREPDLDVPKPVRGPRQPARQPAHRHLAIRHLERHGRQPLRRRGSVSV